MTEPEEAAVAGRLIRGLRAPFRALQRYFYKREVRRVRRRTAERIHRATDGTVQAGPLAGMRVVAEEVWGHNLTARLLGTFEEELHEPLRRLVRTRQPDTVVVVGCAEGYWAVGLALLVPDATIRAFEAAPDARQVAARNARANGVSERLDLRGRCGRTELDEALAEAGRALCLVDVEGGEAELLRPDAVPGLRSAELVVECHDRWAGSIRKRLAGRFRASHEVEFLPARRRAPPDHEVLRPYPDLEAYLAVMEMRSRSAGWLVARAREERG